MNQWVSLSALERPAEGDDPFGAELRQQLIELGAKFDGRVWRQHQLSGEPAYFLAPTVGRPGDQQGADHPAVVHPPAPKLSPGDGQ